MPDDQNLACPGCGQPMNQVSNQGVRHECANCGGRLMGLAPFERLLQDGVGARLWVASAQSGPAGVPCPFCANPTHLPAPTSDGPAPDGLALCHICEQVWVPAPATDWLNAHAAATATPFAPIQAPPPLPAQCENCGAPMELDEMGCCRFCHAQLTAPVQPVIINFGGQAAPQPHHTGNRLLDSLANILTQPID